MSRRSGAGLPATLRSLLSRRLMVLARQVSHGTITRTTALKQAETLFNDHYQRILPYVWRTQVRGVVDNPVQLNSGEREKLRQSMIKQALDTFNQVLSDVP